LFPIVGVVGTGVSDKRGPGNRRGKALEILRTST